MTLTDKHTRMQAATAANKTLPEFLLDSALQAAGDTLEDRRNFVLDAECWEAFRAALDRPPADNPRLRALFACKPPWEE